MYHDMIEKPVFLNQCGIKSCNEVKILIKWVWVAELHLINFRENLEFYQIHLVKLSI